MPTSPRSAKRCHSEPVRRLAWESVSPRLPLRGRCQREALTEGEMPRVFLSPSRLRRQPPPRGGLTARCCRADGTSYPKGICSAALHCRTPSPTRGSTYRPVGRGPCAPPPGTLPAQTARSAVIPSQCAPRSKCPWGTHWRGNPFSLPPSAREVAARSADGGRDITRYFLSPSRLRRQPPPRGGLAARRCRADGTSGTPSRFARFLSCLVGADDSVRPA